MANANKQRIELSATELYLISVLTQEICEPLDTISKQTMYSCTSGDPSYINIFVTYHRISKYNERVEYGYLIDHIPYGTLFTQLDNSKEYSLYELKSSKQYWDGHLCASNTIELLKQMIYNHSSSSENLDEN